MGYWIIKWLITLICSFGQGYEIHIHLFFFFTCSHMTFIVWSVCLYVNLFVAVLANSLLVYLDRCICLIWASLLVSLFVSVCKQEFVCISCCVNQFNYLFVFEFCWLISVFVCLYLLVCQLVYLFEFALCGLIKEVRSCYQTY